MIAVAPRISEGKMTACGQIAQQIINKLMSGEFEQGHPVRESKLAKEFETSRNVIREALNLIVGMGILEYVPFSGYRTKCFTLQDLLEWYEIREGIEPIACRRLAVSRPLPVIRKLEELRDRQQTAFAEKKLVEAFNLDSEFHLSIIRGCGNELFIGLADSGFISIAFLFKNQMLLHAQGVNIYFSDQDARETIEVHTNIIEAIKASDPETASREARIHANIQVRTMERIIAQNGISTPISLNLAEALAAASQT